MKYRFTLVILFCAITAASAQNTYSVSFDGSAILNCGTSADYNITGTGITAEAWIYPTTFATNYWEGTVIGKDGLNNTGFVLRCGAAGRLSFVIAVTGNIWVEVLSTTNVLALNRWQHVAGVYNGSTMKIYINGIEVQSVNESRSMIADASYPMYVGYSPSAWASPRTFTGKIDEVRVWNTARTATEIRNNLLQHLSSGTGLVLSYQMSNGSGTSVTDNSGNGHTGTLGTGTSWVASPVQYTGNALSLDGTDDFIQEAHKTAQDISTAITLEAWIYATKNSGVQNVICKSSASVNSGYIFPRTDDAWTSCVFYLHIGGAWRTVSATYPSLNAWHHLAATYDGSTMKIYIDGVLSASQAQTGAIATNSNNLVIGNQPGVSEYFGGNVDDIRIWNVARTQAEIQASMSHELDPATATGLVSYFTCNQGIAAGTNTGLSALIDQAGTESGVLNNFSLSGASSNYITQYASLTVLPLENAGIAAKRNGEDVIITCTMEPGSTSQTVLQYSEDAVKWVTLAVLPIPLQKTYSYRQVHAGSGPLYYRLQQIKPDNTISYSKVCRLLPMGSKAAISVYPNPVSGGTVYLQLEKSGQVLLLDQAGRVIRSQYLERGSQQFTVSGIPSGVYQVYIAGDGHPCKLVIR